MICVILANIRKGLKMPYNLLDETGKPDIEKMKLITYNPINHSYIALGNKAGSAFYDGKQLK